MNWVYNLCSCFSPQLRTSIIDYLNSNKLNEQVIQQEKCTQQDRQGQQSDPTDHVYQRAKNQSFNFMKLEQHSDDQQQTHDKQIKKSHTLNQLPQSNDELIDVFWYPPFISGSRWDHYRSIFVHKHKILLNIFEQSANSSNYDKVYASQDELNLVIYCRLQSLIKGKKINSYRFSFDMPNIKMEQYTQCLSHCSEKQIYHLIDQVQKIESDPSCPQFILKYHLFKKLLVISPHELVTAHKTQDSLDEQSFKCKLTIAFSVDADYNKNKINNNLSRGWLHLCGLKAIQTKQGLHFDGYINLQLDVSVSPNMLKQPISKQIRMIVQKLVCAIRKSDEI